MEPTVAFHTLGCKLNFAETSAVARQLKDAGFSKVNFEEKAEVYVINTCSVTENADRECKAVVRKALLLNPDAFVAIIGCYAQLKPKKIASIEGVDLVLGANEKFNLPFYLNNFSKKHSAEVHSCEISDIGNFISAYSSGDRTRSFLKVQDGCDYPCTYCTIPLARGKSRSDSIENVIIKAKEIAEKGIKEIVLTGVNIGDFGKVNDERQNSFLDLIQQLDGVEGIERYRISSIEPNLLTDEIISFVAQSKKFVPHFHIPLQSGSDKILALMKRRYRRSLYTERINRIKELLPQACIGVDVITGFPGEDENDFLQTYQYLNELPISYLHVFTYSERENTEAVLLKNTVPISVRKERNHRLRILSEKKLRAFYSEHESKTFTVIFEYENKNGFMFGYTENYIRVKAVYNYSFTNIPLDVELLKQDSENVYLINSVNLKTKLPNIEKQVVC